MIFHGVKKMNDAIFWEETTRYVAARVAEHYGVPVESVEPYLRAGFDAATAVLDFDVRTRMTGAMPSDYGIKCKVELV